MPSNEPPSESGRYCPGGPAVETEWAEHIARCRCGLWFTTLMDQPVFRPHTIHIDDTATWRPDDSGQRAVEYHRQHCTDPECPCRD